MIWLPVSSHRMRSPLALVNDNCGRRAPSAIIVHSNFRHSCSKRCKKDYLPCFIQNSKIEEFELAVESCGQEVRTSTPRYVHFSQVRPAR